MCFVFICGRYHGKSFMILLMEFMLAKGTNESKPFSIWNHSTFCWLSNITIILSIVIFITFIIVLVAIINFVSRSYEWKIYKSRIINFWNQLLCFTSVLRYHWPKLITLCWIYLFSLESQSVVIQWMKIKREISNLILKTWISFILKIFAILQFNFSFL